MLYKLMIHGDAAKKTSEHALVLQCLWILIKAVELACSLIRLVSHCLRLNPACRTATNRLRVKTKSSAMPTCIQSTLSLKVQHQRGAVICTTSTSVQNHGPRTHPFGGCKERLCQQLLEAKESGHKTPLHAQKAHRHQARHHKCKEQQATSIQGHSANCTHRNG